jgi:ankyrin repeat protein
MDLPEPNRNQSDHENIISVLPPELLVDLAIKFLETKEMLRFGQTCHYLNQILCQDLYIWRLLMKRDFTEREMPKSTNYQKLYREIYRKFHPPSWRRQNYTPEKSFKDQLLRAAMNGYEKIIQRLVKNISTHPDVYNTPMACAAQGGYQEIVNQMLQLGANDYDLSLIKAAFGGQHQMIDQMLQLGAHDYDGAMISAAKGGHIDIIGQMIKLGATDYDEAMIGAAEYDHLDIVKAMIQLGADEYNDALIAAAENDNIDTVKYMIKMGANDYNNAMISAAYYNNIDIVRYMLELGADSYEAAIRQAREHGHDEIVTMLQHHRDNWQFINNSINLVIRTI